MTGVDPFRTPDAKSFSLSAEGLYTSIHLSVSRTDNIIKLQEE